MNNELIERIDAEIRVWNTDCDYITLNRILMRQLSTLLSDCKAALTRKESSIALLEQRICDYLYGRCVCPPMDGDVDRVEHYPGCPVINKQKIEALTQQLEVEPVAVLPYTDVEILGIARVAGVRELMHGVRSDEVVATLRCFLNAFLPPKPAAQPEIMQNMLDAKPLGAEFARAMMEDTASLYAYDETRTAVPLAGVPDAIPMRPYQTISTESPSYKAGWNACRKAMLSAAKEDSHV